MKRQTIVATLLIASILGLALAGCGNTTSHQAGHDHEMAPLGEMPFNVRQAPVAVQEAYQFAVANPDILQQIPCYCGCGSMGHTSNYSCYVSGEDEAGAISFDAHALGCSICVDITQDTMRLLDQGKRVPAIFNTIDQTYSRFGPPTPLS